MSQYKIVDDISEIKLMKKCNESCLPENYQIDIWKNIINGAPNISIIAKQNENRIKGYIMMSLDVDPNVVTIASIAVYHKYRGKGIGTELITKALNNVRQFYPNKKAVKLNVRVSNNVAINVYKKIGFTENQKIRNYYQDEDAWEMIFNLDS